MVMKLSEHFMKRDDKLYVKCKGYNSSFNSWIDRKDLIKLVGFYWLKFHCIK